MSEPGPPAPATRPSPSAKTLSVWSVAALGIGSPKAVVFVISMLVGMAVFEGAERMPERLSTNGPSAWTSKTPAEC